MSTNLVLETLVDGTELPLVSYADWRRTRHLTCYGKNVWDRQRQGIVCQKCHSFSTIVETDQIPR